MPQAEDAKQHCSRDRGVRVCSFQECVCVLGIEQLPHVRSQACAVCSLRALLIFIPVAVVFVAYAAVLHSPSHVNVMPPWLPVLLVASSPGILPPL
jgi:hypothetical protein